jgi:hypothetical protein
VQNGDSFQINNPSDPPQPPDGDEANMRRALGLDPGSAPAVHQGARTFDKRPPRRHFAVDGDVPVVLIGHRGHRGLDGEAAQQPGGAIASNSRLAELEAALKAEQEARQRAERALQEAQATVRDLQTRLEHVRLERDDLRQTAMRADADRLAMATELAERDGRQNVADGNLPSGRRERTVSGRPSIGGIVRRLGRPPGSKNRVRMAVGVEPGNRTPPPEHLPAAVDQEIAGSQEAAPPTATVPAAAPAFAAVKRLGRPVGSKNRVRLAEVLETEGSREANPPAGEVPAAGPAARRPGRPVGSKNRKTLLRAAEQARQQAGLRTLPVAEGPPPVPAVRAEQPLIKRVGRPPGSLNRKALPGAVGQEAGQQAARWSLPVAQDTTAAPAGHDGAPAKRRGRPPGSKNRTPAERVKEPKPIRWW